MKTLLYIMDNFTFARLGFEKHYCQAQPEPKFNWADLALFSLWRNYAAQMTAYAAPPAA